MVRCCVLGCKNRSERCIKGITFHQFPPYLETLKIWVKATGRTNWQPSKYSKICSAHFLKDTFIHTSKRVYLRDFSVPTINLKVEKGKKFTNSRASKSKIVRTANELTTSQKSDMQPQPSTSKHSDDRLLVERQNIASKSHAIPTTEEPNYEKEIFLEKILAREREKSAKRLKKVRALRESKRRITKKIALLEDVLADLQFKMKMKLEEIDLLSGIDTEN